MVSGLCFATVTSEDGIDPSLAFLDGRVFYTRNGRGADPDHPLVYQGELSLAGGPPITVEPRVIWPERT